MKFSNLMLLLTFILALTHAASKLSLDIKVIEGVARATPCVVSLSTYFTEMIIDDMDD